MKTKAPYKPEFSQVQVIESPKSAQTWLCIKFTNGRTWNTDLKAGRKYGHLRWYVEMINLYNPDEVGMIVFGFETYREAKENLADEVIAYGAENVYKTLF